MNAYFYQEFSVVQFCSSMELRMNVNVISILVFIASFAGIINCVCIVDKHATSQKLRYHCVNSTDYVSDASRGPIDIKIVTFSISNIPKISNAVFDRFSRNLSALEILSSRVKEIEDDAFQGLNELRVIDVAGNELEVVKEAWFKGLSKLEFVSLNHNKIRQIEDAFFSTVSPLKHLAIRHNKLTCISKSALSTLTVKEIMYDFNPWSWKCLSDLVDLFDEKNTKYNRNSYDDWHMAGNVTKNCIAQSPDSQPQDYFINKCVRAAIAQWIPSMQSYTAIQVCALPNESPFLWCGRRKSSE